MTADPAFRREQRGVGIRMAAAIAVSVLAIAASLWSASVMSLADRLGTAVATALATLVWLPAAIANVARIRFFSPDDIAGGGRTSGSGRIRDASAVLQNTLEQVVLAIPVQLATAVVIERSTMLLIVLAILFAVGRLLFWHGYANGATTRALGFALTFYPTVTTLLIVLVAIALR